MFYHLSPTLRLSAALLLRQAEKVLKQEPAERRLHAQTCSSAKSPRKIRIAKNRGNNLFFVGIIEIAPGWAPCQDSATKKLAARMFFWHTAALAETMTN